MISSCETMFSQSPKLCGLLNFWILYLNISLRKLLFLFPCLKLYFSNLNLSLNCCFQDYDLVEADKPNVFLSLMKTLIWLLVFFNMFFTKLISDYFDGIIWKWKTELVQWKIKIPMEALNSGPPDIVAVSLLENWRFPLSGHTC